MVDICLKALNMELSLLHLRTMVPKVHFRMNMAVDMTVQVAMAAVDMVVAMVVDMVVAMAAVATAAVAVDMVDMVVDMAVAVEVEGTLRL